MDKEAARRVVQMGLEALEGEPSQASDDELTASLVRHGISEDDAVRFLALVPLAFGRAMLQREGFESFENRIKVGHPDGKNTLIDLSEQPLYEAALRMGVEIVHHGTTTPRAFEMLAGSSVEIKLLPRVNECRRSGKALGISIGLAGYEEGLFVAHKPPWWLRRIF